MMSNKSYDTTPISNKRRGVRKNVSKHHPKIATTSRTESSLKDENHQSASSSNMSKTPTRKNEQLCESPQFLQFVESPEFQVGWDDGFEPKNNKKLHIDANTSNNKKTLITNELKRTLRCQRIKINDSVETLAIDKEKLPENDDFLQWAESLLCANPTTNVKSPVSFTSFNSININTDTSFEKNNKMRNDHKTPEKSSSGPSSPTAYSSEKKQNLFSQKFNESFDCNEKDIIQSFKKKKSPSMKSNTKQNRVKNVLFNNTDFQLKKSVTNKTDYFGQKCDLIYKPTKTSFSPIGIDNRNKNNESFSEFFNDSINEQMIQCSQAVEMKYAEENNNGRNRDSKTDDMKNDKAICDSRNKSETVNDNISMSNEIRFNENKLRHISDKKSNVTNNINKMISFETKRNNPCNKNNTDAVMNENDLGKEDIASIINLLDDSSNDLILECTQQIENTLLQLETNNQDRKLGSNIGNGDEKVKVTSNVNNNQPFYKNQQNNMNYVQFSENVQHSVDNKQTSSGIEHIQNSNNHIIADRHNPVERTNGGKQKQVNGFKKNENIVVNNSKINASENRLRNGLHDKVGSNECANRLPNKHCLSPSRIDNQSRKKMCSNSVRDEVALKENDLHSFLNEDVDVLCTLDIDQVVLSQMPKTTSLKQSPQKTCINYYQSKPANHPSSRSDQPTTVAHKNKQLTLEQSSIQFKALNSNCNQATTTYQLNQLNYPVRIQKTTPNGAPVAESHPKIPSQSKISVPQSISSVPNSGVQSKITNSEIQRKVPLTNIQDNKVVGPIVAQYTQEQIQLKKIEAKRRQALKLRKQKSFEIL